MDYYECYTYYNVNVWPGPLHTGHPVLREHVQTHFWDLCHSLRPHCIFGRI